MLFKQLVLTNFGPYLGKNTIDLEHGPQGGEGNIILVGAMNGAGKTTILDAIKLALYGNRARLSSRGSLPYRTYLERSINYRADPTESASIELIFNHFTSGDETEYKIRRRWDNQNSQGETLSVFRDGALDSALTETWSERVEDLLPLGISNLFLFDGEQVKELAEQEVPPDEVKQAVRTLLGLELPERVAADLDILISRKHKLAARPDNLKEIETLEEELSKAKSALEDVKQEMASLRARKERATDAVRKAKEKFISEGGQFAERRAELKSRRDSFHEKKASIEGQIRELAAGSMPLLLIEGILTRAERVVRDELDFDEKRVKLEILVDHHRRLNRLLDSMTIPDRSKTKINKFLDLERKTYRVKNCEVRLGASSMELHQLTELLSKRLSIEKKELLTLLSALDEVAGKIENTSAKLETAASPENLERLLTSISSAEASLAVISMELNKREEDQNSVAHACTLLEGKLRAKLSEDVEGMLAEEADARLFVAADRVKETLREFGAKLKIKKLNQLENNVTECFKHLIRKQGFAHRVEVDTETFDLSLYDPAGIKIDKKRLSAGEKQLLAVAFLWGLARCSGRSLPMVIDTPLGRLDSEHRSNLVNRYFPHASHQVVILSTDTEIDHSFVSELSAAKAISRQYLLKFDQSTHRTHILPGYFWQE